MQLNICCVGSPDFNLRTKAELLQADNKLLISSANLTEAWSELVSQRPEIMIFEIGQQHNQRKQQSLTQFLSQLRARFAEQIYIVVACTATEKLAYAGELLFAEPDQYLASNYVDTFVVKSPAGITSLANISEQLISLIPLVKSELQRRLEQKIPLPALNSPGWVQSLADPQSRDLWMRWLPRYASYSNENPLIVGETGTGKTNLAYALHLLSGRTGNFISMTPRDFSSAELVQAELFGAVPGAYTGAVEKWGLVKSAENGTLFIDELQSIDKDLQGKIITFIESKVYRRVGSAETIQADVRFVFAANRSLQEMISSNVLRDDFAYRLERVRLDLLPLQKRRLDIAASLAYALAKIRRQRPQAQVVEGLTSEAYSMLLAYKWPGNLRQLENTIAQLCEQCDFSGQALIDQATVSQIFANRLVTSGTTAAELIADAANKLARQALTRPINTINLAQEELENLIRAGALEVSAGDFEKAAELICDQAKLLEFFSLGAEIKKA